MNASVFPEKCSRIFVVPVAREPGIWRAVVSTASRVYEEYGFNCIVLVYGRKIVEEQKALEEVMDALRKTLPEIPIIPWTRVIRVDFSGSLERSIRRMVEELCKLFSCGNIILSPTPGSRRLAAAIGMASIGGEGGGPGADVVHIDFYWGPWKGLYYPFTLRVVQPAIAQLPVHGPCTKKPLLLPDRPELVDPPPKLPPLKKHVGMLALEVNMAHAYHAVMGGEECSEQVALSLVVEGPEGSLVEECVVRNTNEYEEWLAGLERLEKAIWEIVRMRAMDRDRHLVDSVTRTILSLGGVWRLIVKSSTMRIELEDAQSLVDYGGPVLPDTNLVYLGLHNDAYEGLQIVIPYCLQAEILRGYAEAVKHHRLRADFWRSFEKIMAKAALEEIARSGAAIAASPPPPCDTSIPSMDLIQLSSVKPATNDQGAYTLWKEHPFARASDTLLVEPRPLAEMASKKSREWVIAASSYAFLQTLLILSTALRLESCILHSKQPRVRIVVEGEKAAKSVEVGVLHVFREFCPAAQGS